MGMKGNWTLFVETSKKKSQSHMKAAHHWYKVHLTLQLILIFLSAATTVLALLDAIIPFYIVAIVSGLTTLLSALLGFLQPSKRRQIQLESARDFRQLASRMIRCENSNEYEELWNEYNKALLSEPFVPKRFVVAAEVPYFMSDELTILIAQKEGAASDAPIKDGDAEEGAAEELGE